MKDFAKLRSHQIDKDFTKVTTQYLHFMNKYQKKFVFRHKNNFNFRLIDQGPLEGLYVTEVTAVVYSKSGDFIQHKSIGGRYYLMLDHESYYSNNDYKSRFKYPWYVWVSDFISPDCKKYFVKKFNTNLTSIHKIEEVNEEVMGIGAVLEKGSYKSSDDATGFIGLISYKLVGLSLFVIGTLIVIFIRYQFMRKGENENTY